jgi:hypothetical protein
MDASRETNPVRHLPGEVWTTGEVTLLRRHAPLGAYAVSEILGRTVRAVRCQANRQGISLRTEEEHRGRLLGLKELPDLVGPARAKRLRDIRERALAGETDPALLDARTTALARGDPLCPRCTSRPAEVETTGFCRECHLRLYLEVDEATDIRAAQRDNDRMRQQKHRAKVREEA